MKSLFDKNEYFTQEARDISHEMDMAITDLLEKYPKHRVRELEFLFHQAVGFACAKVMIERRRESEKKVISE